MTSFFENSTVLEGNLKSQICEQVDSHGGPWRKNYYLDLYLSQMDIEFLKIIKVSKPRNVFSILPSSQKKRSSKSLSLESRLKSWGTVILQTFFWRWHQIRKIYIYSKIVQPLIIYVTNNEIDYSFHQWIQRRENLFTNYKLSFLARRDGCVGCWYCITYLAVIEWGAIHD